MGNDIVEWLQARDWNQFTAVFLGAFLAFIAGIAVQQIAECRARRVNRRMLRQLIATEVVQDMETVDYTVRLVQLTRDEGFVARHSPTSLPRWDILRQCLGGQMATALTAVEQAALRSVVGNLQTFGGEYDSWEKSLTDATPVLSDDSAKVTTYREHKTERLLNTVDLLQTSLLEMLIYVCNFSREGELHDDDVESIRKKLTPTRQGFPNRPNFGRAYRTLMVAGLPQDKLREHAYLVVWMHDWPECPIQVIELQTERGKQAEPTLHLRPPSIGGGSR